jgi:HPt (histidine-containing phosphotransfer) domain-containing protein
MIESKFAMNIGESSKPFIFNEEIDAQCITDLYGEDYAYIEEVFETVLKEFDLLSSNIALRHDSGDIESLRSAVHKIKPIFGFAGLTLTQQQCQQFENLCQRAESFDMLTNDYIILQGSLRKSRSVIEEEKRKLELFNRHRA